MGTQTIRAYRISPPSDSVELAMERPPQGLALTDLEPGQTAVIDQISLPSADAHFLMRIGFFPGAQVQFCRRAPLGDPSIYSVDGTQIALRAETARHILVRPAEAEAREFNAAGELS